MMQASDYFCGLKPYSSPRSGYFMDCAVMGNGYLGDEEASASVPALPSQSQTTIPSSGEVLALHLKLTCKIGIQKTAHWLSR